MEEKNLKTDLPDDKNKDIKEDTTMQLQCKKTHKQGDEDSWISGEELHTDGSDDEEILRHKRTIRKKKDLYFKRQQSLATFSQLKAKCSAATQSGSLTESLNLENKWRPKRGSLKLHNLSDAEDTSIARNQQLTEYEKEHAEKMNHLSRAIEKLEEQFYLNCDLLKIEKKERADLHKQLKLLTGDEDSSSDPEEVTAHDDNKKECSNGDFKEREDITEKKFKDAKFIHRNIELAGKPNYSITDDEKSKLDEILSEIDFLTPTESDISNEAPSKRSFNAYTFSVDDLKRLEDINKALKACEDSFSVPVKTYNPCSMIDQESFGDIETNLHIEQDKSTNN